MNRRAFFGTVLGLALVSLSAFGDASEKANVLFIALDDMNDWIRVLDPEAPIKTPHMDRLAQRATQFSNAYCASPACNPSRTAVMTGLAPTTSGVYGNKSHWRKALPEAVTISQHFMQQGYEVCGAGKIFHHHYGGAFHDAGSFQDFQLMPDPPDHPMPKEKLNQLPKYGSPNTDWGVWPPDEADAVDTRTTDYIVEALQRPHEKPFFLAAGLFRPHMPFFAPQRFFNLYPEAEIEMPKVFENDLDDLPSGAHKLLNAKKWFFRGLMEAEKKNPGTWKAAVRAYQASASFADAQIGRMLDALEASPYADNTIIVLWSDHGYHLGEKEHWEKFALWEKANHVPFMIAAPGIAKEGGVCEQPVSLLDIYPTLLSLCGLTPRPEVDGLDLSPLLKNPETRWERPAIMTYQQGNHAIRDTRWRYIRYADGTEELYDHQDDPNEWRNLADLPDHEAVKAALRKWIPKTEAPPAPDMTKKEAKALAKKAQGA